MKMEELVGTLTDAPRVLWQYHIKTRKYSAHKALDECYNEMTELADALIEAWIGDNDHELGELTSVLEPGDDVVEYINNLKQLLKDGRKEFFEGTTELESACDDILKLLDGTLYKLNKLTESRVTAESINIDYSEIKDENDIWMLLESMGLMEEDEVKKNEVVVTNNDLPVNYSDLKEIKKNPGNIFEHIIVFTNDNREAKNKTLKHIVEAIENLKKAKCDCIPTLHVFESDSLMYDEGEEKITINDSESSMEINEEFNNTNTLVISRLGVQGEDNCEQIVKILQDRGFIVLNPVRYSALACNKYETAILLDKAEIPQPRFALINKDILYDKDLYKLALKDIYPDWDFEENDKNSDKMVVVKILDGHGGTGVSLISGDKLYSILQLIFAVKKDINLLLQKKEEADGGDIRVHVLTLRGKQVILAAMKRVKISGDFRSNVSLGATAEPVKLTPEQEQIALKTALVSKLPWCAVDIMPLVKGSNKEIGDNVVLEINASPGTEGISDVIGMNFINVLLYELDDPGAFNLQDKVAGYIESVDIDFGDGIKKTYLGKLDTGNSVAAGCLEVGDYEIKGGKITFKIDDKKVTFKHIKDVVAIVGDHKVKRPVIMVPEIAIGNRKVRNCELGIVNNRSTKKTNILINRDILSKLGYTIHPAMSHILTPEMQKVKIIN